MKKSNDSFRRWAWRAVWVAGFYFLFAAITWKAVPWAVRRALSSVPAALPGFHATVEEAAFNPFTLRLTLRGLSASQERLGEFASCRELSVALGPAALLRFAVGLREIRLAGPKFAFMLAPDGTSLLDTLPKSVPQSAPQPAGKSFIPRIVIGALIVSDGELNFESQLRSAPQRVTARPIEFRLENLSTIPKDGGSYRLQARTNRGENLAWQGEMTLRPLRLSGAVDLSDIDLTRVSTAAPTLPVRIDQGRSNVSFKYDIAIDSGALTTSLKDVRFAITQMLWTLKGVQGPARGPFSLGVGPAEISATASALGLPGAKVTLRADVPVEESGAVRIRAFVVPRPLAGGAEFDVVNLPLAPFSPLAPPPTQFSVDGGTFSVRSRAALSNGQIDGELSLGLADLQISEKKSGRAFVKLGRFAVDSARFSTRKRTIETSAIRIEKPFLRLTRAKNGMTDIESAIGISLSSAPTSTPSAPAVPPSAAGNPWKARLKRFELTGGRVVAQDEAVTPSFAFDISGARFAATGLSDDGRSTATFSAAALLDRAPLSIQGAIRLSTAAAWGQARVKLDGMQLPLFSPYSGKFIGYKIDRGAFSLDLDHRIEGRKIETQNHAVIDQMTLGDKVESPDALKVPVRLGLAILKDRRGVIDLNLPVDGSLDDPSFHVAGAILKTLVNLIIKAAVSPFSALSEMMGSKNDLGKVVFAPASAELTADAAAQLNQVAKILNERPEMLVGVRAAAGRADSLAAGDAELMRRLRGRNPDASPLSPREEKRVLDLYKGNFDAQAASVQEARSKLDSKWRSGDAELRALALARASAITAALSVQGVAPARFFSLEPTSGVDASDVSCQLQLDLK